MTGSGSLPRAWLRRMSPRQASPRQACLGPAALRIAAPRWLALAALLALAPLSPARAGEVTVESIIDQASALRDAASQVPSGAHITGSECSEVALPGLSYRYRCTVRYSTPADPQPAPGGATRP